MGFLTLFNMSRRTRTRRTCRAVAFTTAVVCGCVGSTVHGNGLEPSTDPTVEPVEIVGPPVAVVPVVAVGLPPVPPVAVVPVVAVGLPPVPPVAVVPVVAVGLPPVPPVADVPVVAVGSPPVPPVADVPVVAVGSPPVADVPVVAITTPPVSAPAASIEEPAGPTVGVHRINAVLRGAAASVAAAIALVDTRL